MGLPQNIPIFMSMGKAKRLKILSRDSWLHLIQE